jgi:hypothetical protein
MTNFKGARYQGPRNAGGWPARKKHIFDATAKRRADKALGILERAHAHIRNTCTYRDPAEFFMDLDSSAAFDVLLQAQRDVQAANETAQALAKAKEAYAKGSIK